MVYSTYKQLTLQRRQECWPSLLQDTPAGDDLEKQLHQKYVNFNFVISNKGLMIDSNCEDL